MSWTHADWAHLSLDGAGTAADLSTAALTDDFDTALAPPGATLSASASTGKITVAEAGWYSVMWGANCLGSNAKSITVEVRKNTTAVGGTMQKLEALTSHLTPHGAGVGIVWCEVGDYLALWFDASDGTNWTPTDLSLLVQRIG